MKIVILAGGGGTRLWPISRKNQPKQSKPFLDNETLLQKTYNRLRTGFRAEDIFISTNIVLKNDIKFQFPDLNEENLILEPLKRDTAAAVGFSAIKIFHKFPKEVIIFVNSDHYIKDVPEFIRILKQGAKLAEKKPQRTVLIGVNPSYPETGYGYIKIDKSGGKIGNDEYFEVESFVEKPNLDKARKYLQDWHYLWNPAYFIWRVDHLLLLFKKYLPDTYKILNKINDKIDDPDFFDNTLSDLFAAIKPISIDYGIMEKIDDMLVIPADFGWTDIGHWKTIKDVLANGEDNIVKGKYIGIDSKGNLIYSATKKLITTVGVQDMIIVETPDALLVCPIDQAHDVKKLVEKLQKAGMDEYL